MKEACTVVTSDGKRERVEFSNDDTVGEFAAAAAKILQLPRSTVRLLYSGQELKPKHKKMHEFNIGKYGNYMVHLQTTTISVVDNEDHEPISHLRMKPSPADKTAVDLSVKPHQCQMKTKSRVRRDTVVDLAGDSDDEGNSNVKKPNSTSCHVIELLDDDDDDDDGDGDACEGNKICNPGEKKELNLPERFESEEGQVVSTPDYDCTCFLQLERESRKSSLQRAGLQSNSLVHDSSRLLFIFSSIHFPDSKKRLPMSQWDTVKQNGLCLQKSQSTSSSADCSIRRNTETSTLDSNDPLLTPMNVPITDQVWITFKVMDIKKGDEDMMNESLQSKDNVVDASKVYNVVIGQVFTCDCKENFLQENELDIVHCRHIEFVLEKILKIPLSSPIVCFKYILQLELWSLMFIHDANACEQYQKRCSHHPCSDHINLERAPKETSSNSMAVRNESHIDVLHEPVSEKSFVVIDSDSESDSSSEIVFVERGTTPQNLTSSISESNEVGDIKNVFDEECAVCFEVMHAERNGNKRQADIDIFDVVEECSCCGKSLHKECLEAWQAHSQTCPSCRNVWKKKRPPPRKRKPLHRTPQHRSQPRCKKKRQSTQYSVPSVRNFLGGPRYGRNVL